MDCRTNENKRVELELKMDRNRRTGTIWKTSGTPHCSDYHYVSKTTTAAVPKYTVNGTNLKDSHFHLSKRGTITTDIKEITAKFGRTHRAR